MDEIGKNNDIYYKGIYMDDVLINDDQSYSYSKIDNLCKKIQQQADTNVFIQADIDTGIGTYGKKNIGQRGFLWRWRIVCITGKNAEIGACEK